ncbi:MAG TPA: glycosyltransferase [Bryobacteraceae bacterium]|nr:glycosyltransferase [Bryobacteraceae bacterium]
MNTPPRVSTKRILVLTVSLAPGGAEAVVTQLALALRSAGYEVSVVSMMKPTAFVAELEAADVNVVWLGMNPGQPNIRSIVRFFSYLRHYRPHIIHSHMFHANILARLARLLTGINIVSTIHSEIECSHKNNSARCREWVYRMTNAVGGRVTAVSRRVRERYVAENIIPADRIQVIDNGVDLDRFRPCVERRVQTRDALGWHDFFVWLAVGRLEIVKNYPTLIRAFEKVHERFPASRLVIAGDGRLRPQIERLIQQRELQSAVSLLGPRTDVPDLLNASDALVMCSQWEGGPLVLLEAAAAARPVVSTAVGAAPEIVLPGQTGLLVPPGDTNALTQAMAELTALGVDRLAEMGREARDRIQDQFSLPSVHHHYMSLYEEVLSINS